MNSKSGWLRNDIGFMGRQVSPKRLRVFGWLLLVLGGMSHDLAADERPSAKIDPPQANPTSARETPTVRLIQKVEAAVVGVFSQATEGELVSGSGSVIHEDGFILTCDHVVGDRRGVVLLSDSTVRPYRTVGRLSEKDLTVIQVPAPRPLRRIVLGRSHDLRTGEPVLVGGNPGGRGIVFSSGIISSPRIMINVPNALVMAGAEDQLVDRRIQFDAASNRGNSGGPLINVEGVQIGIVSHKNPMEENINFAIPVDRVRQVFPEIIAPEVLADFWVGLNLDMLADRAVVTSVAEGSPAASAGLQAGDVVVAADGRPIRYGVDWVLTLLGGKAGASFTIRYERGGSVHETNLTTKPYPVAPSVAEDGKKPGLRFSLYHLDRPPKLPDFATLKPVRSGVTSSLEPGPLASGRKGAFGLVFEGFLRVPDTGLYRLVLVSDDGSRLLLHGKMVIDNDGVHPPLELGRYVRLAAGLHPIRIDFFEAYGSSDLKLYLQSAPGERTLAGEGMLFHE